MHTCVSLMRAEAEEEVYCAKCGEKVDGLAKLTCKACNTKRSQLSQMFGNWPIPCFAEMNEEAQKFFWKQGSGCKKVRDLEALLIKHVSDYKEKTDVAKEGGKFLPLSVYKTMGYGEDERRGIVENSESRFDDELQCTCYKLTMHEAWRVEITKKVREDIANLKNGPSLRNQLGDYASPAKGKKKKKSSKSSSSSSSSKSSKSSSSSSDQGEEAAKKKKAAAELKAKKKAEAEAKRAAAAETRVAEAEKKKEMKAVEFEKTQKRRLEAKEQKATAQLLAKKQKCADKIVADKAKADQKAVQAKRKLDDQAEETAKKKKLAEDKRATQQDGAPILCKSFAVARVGRWPPRVGCEVGWLGGEDRFLPMIPSLLSHFGFRAGRGHAEGGVEERHPWQQLLAEPHGGLGVVRQQSKDING